MNANVKTAGKTVDTPAAVSVSPIERTDREGVKSYVEAQKALMDVMVKPPNAAKTVGKAGASRQEAGKEGEDGSGSSLTDLQPFAAASDSFDKKQSH